MKKDITDKTIPMKKTNNSFQNKVRSNTMSEATNKEVISNNKELYVGYKVRLTIYAILFVIFFIICLLFASKTLEREQLSPIIYNEKSNINYKVYLYDNNFYEQQYLDMNKAYVASLIDYIDVNFNYLFSIKKDSTIDFDYKILGELVIENNGGTKRYFEKTYTLLDTQNKKLVNNKMLEITENVKIDYDYYNRLANSFRSSYGVDTNSYLNLYLEVKEKGDANLNYKIDQTNKVLLKIPLSQKAIEINLDADNSDVIKQIIPAGKVIFNLKYLILEIMFFIITVVLFLKSVRYISLFFKNKTSYDKYVNKILKEYDRLIVETHTEMNFTNYNVIEVKKFTELLDVRDNLKVPILYYNILKHQKGIFYIKDNMDIYLLTIKNIDLEKNNI